MRNVSNEHISTVFLLFFPLFFFCTETKKPKWMTMNALAHETLSLTFIWNSMAIHLCMPSMLLFSLLSPQTVRTRFNVCCCFCLLPARHGLTYCLRILVKCETGQFRAFDYYYCWCSSDDSPSNRQQ